MTSTPSPRFDTLREAYAAVYHCAPEAFERRVFWKGLYRHAWLPAHWMWWFEREFFRPDLEAVRAIGNARNEPDLQRAIDDLENHGLVERSIRRGRLMIRLSPNRLIYLLQPLLPLLHPPAEEPDHYIPVAPVRELTSEEPRSGGRSPHAARAGERIPGGVQLVRVLKRLHGDIVSGRELSLALADAGLTRSEATAALREVASGRAELEWLQGYFQLLDEVERLRSERR
jgi:hypothetical protein